MEKLEEEISFEDFIKIDIRIGQVLKAELVPKSKKLLKLEVDFGSLGIKQVVSGIAESYSPEAIVGIKVLAVVNLKPRQLMGLESQAMLLATKNENGIILATCAGNSGDKLG